MREGGYATYTDGGDFRDGIVVTGFGVLLAHETGHYLGLKHIFSHNSCENNDCNVDGDGICDTPPQSTIGGTCTNPQNSCFTDTLSGFTRDTTDLGVNFMSYNGCANMFTEGQATRMRENLATTRASLLQSYKCDPPCAENLSVRFTRDNWFPVPGNTINFTSTSTNASNFEWTVNGNPAGNNPNLTYTFPALGKYRVSLKVYDGNSSCFATYTHYVLVSCGVMARFYPDKRLIASKAPVMIDTILFTNRSINGSSYRWLMSNDTGMSETVVSTAKDLRYPFVNKGNYNVRLIATNGSCSDTTETFSFKVEDPVLDASIFMFGAECYQQTKVKFSFYVCNNGYAAIPKGMPISFYDGDPRTAGAKKIDSSFLIPDSGSWKML
jgi:PKD repeat protein